MNTFILKWNPAISSYRIEDFKNDFFFNKKGISYDEPWQFNWSVWDYEKAHEGDRFFMLKVGEGDNNGILMSGEFSSEPYEAEDWSGKGRKTFYMDLDFDIVVDVKSNNVLPTDLLTKQFPEMEWTKGHSGVLIDNESALRLEKLWYNHLKGALSPYAKAKSINRIAHFGQKDKGGADYYLHPLRVSQQLYSEKEEIVALLHDVMEDSNFTLEDLANEGFSKEILSSIKAITRKKDELYDTFIHRLGRNKIARKVKMEDLKDNMNILRLNELTDEDFQRLKKYHKAFKYLESIQGPL